MTDQVFILVDTSYWIFYRYFAIMQWWKHAKPDDHLFDNPYENEEFLEKFIKTFLESLEGFKKKQKLHKQRSKPATPCTIIGFVVIVRVQKFGVILYTIVIKKLVTKMILLMEDHFSNIFTKKIINFYISG